MDDVIMLQVAFKFRSLRDGTLIQTCCALRLQKRRFLQFGHQLVVTDNQGNIFSFLNQASKRPSIAVMLMEIMLTLHAAGCFLAPCHLPRADELTHSGYQGFSDEFYLDVKEFFAQFLLLPRLNSGHNLDFTPCPPKIP